MMPTGVAHRSFERVLAAVGECLDRPSAEALLRLHADPELQARIEALAGKNTEDQLTPEEREEYDTLICVGQFVALLQANAHRLQAPGHTS